MSAAVERPRSSGLISADCLYTLSEIQLRLGMGIHAMRMARRSGLKVRRVGRRSYVLGKDVMEYVERVAQVVA